MSKTIIIYCTLFVSGLILGTGFGYDQAEKECTTSTNKLTKAHGIEKEEALERSRTWYRNAADKQHQAMEKAQNDLNRIEADRRSADAARDGLLTEYRRILTGLAANNCDPAAVTDGAPNACTPKMLAELLGELDESAGVYASEADTARARGVACEESYPDSNEKAP